jgi:uncharacterized protein YybS (DUF2232 family)
MNPVVRSSLLWGVVSCLSFLVLVQGFELATGTGVTVVAKAAVAVLVGLLGTAVTYLITSRGGVAALLDGG